MSEQNMKLEKAAESTLARFIVQLITPILLALVAFFGNKQLSSIEAEQARAAKKTEELKDSNAAIASDVRDLNTRFDLLAVKKIDALENRIDRLEKATRTP